MDEHQFDSPRERCYDFGEMCDELRCHTSEWLEVARTEAIAEQRWWRLRELAVTAVLDERGLVDDSTAAKDGTTTRTARRKRATARKLKAQPNVAKAAAQGKLSEEQLDKITDLADGDPEAEERWAREGGGWSPDDLAAELRKKRTPTMEDAAARRAARELCCWWDQDSGMLDGRFSLPDIDGALVQSVLDEMIEKMRPAGGEPWDTREHRGADALVELCRLYADRDANVPTSGYRAHFVVHVPPSGPATVAGVPLPDQMVERLRAEAKIEPVLTGPDGEPLLVGRTESVLSEKTKRVVRQRDGHCRYPGCDRRIGLHVHHLWPASWGGSDEIANLATVCTMHHDRLAPQGHLLLLGNPNHPAGLTLVDRDDLPALATLAADCARAGATAA